MINVIHKSCGNIAFYFKDIVHSGDIIRSSNVILLNGLNAQYGDILICGSCYKQINLSMGELEQLEQSWKDWFIIDKLG